MPLFGYVLMRDESNELVSVDFGYPCPADAGNACTADILQALYKVHRVEAWKGMKTFEEFNAGHDQFRAGHIGNMRDVLRQAREQNMGTGEGTRHV